MANNINLSMLYLGNFADIDPDETNMGAENEASLLGTYGSAGDPLYDYVTDVDSDSPTGDIDTNETTGDGTLTYDIGAGSVTTALDKFVTYNGTVVYGDGSSENIIIDIVQFTNGDVFVPAWDSYTQFATKGIESITLTSVDFDRWAGFLQSSYDSVDFICFAAGTRILTPRGDVPVDMLREGDLVCTLDNGARPVIWIGARMLHFPPSPDRQKPIAFKPGSLGPGIPRAPLVVSPQHRLRLTDGQNRTGDVLAPATAFTEQPGVRRKAGCRRVQYVSLLFAQHQVIFAEGVPVESFYPGPIGLRTLSPLQRLTLIARAPSAHSAQTYGAPARALLDAKSARTRLNARPSKRSSAPVSLSP